MSSDNIRSDGPIPELEPDHDQPEASPVRLRRWPFVAWVVLITALLIWFAAGSVSTTSYSYNQFIQTTFRNVSETSLQDIWTYQAQHLPSAGMQWAVDGAFVASVVIMAAGVVAGSWLLLVRASDEPASMPHRSRRFQRDHSA